jgi:hypothetical protein
LQSNTEQDQPQPRDRFVLSWTAGPEGSFYDVRVMSEQLEPLTRVRGLDRSEFRVPEDVLAELPSGARILWQVTAHLPDARTVESDTFFALVE